MRWYKTSIEATRRPAARWAQRCGAASPPQSRETLWKQSREKMQNLHRLPIFTRHLFEVEKTITYRIPWRPSYFNYIVTEPPLPSPTPFHNPFPSQTHTKWHHVTRSLAHVPAPHHRVITQPGRKRLFLGSVNVWLRLLRKASWTGRGISL